MSEKRLWRLLVDGLWPKRSSERTRWILVCLVALAFVVVAWGIRKHLPYAPEVDEPNYVTRSVIIASTGNLNPGWFGHPGSTTIYPLAAVYRVWYAAMHQGTLFRPDPNLKVAFDTNPTEYFLLGRFLSLIYATLSVPLVYHVGRSAFGERAALVGTGLAILSPVSVFHYQLARTYAPATFFVLLSLWLCLRLLNKPSVRARALAAAAIGLAMASRYFTVALVSVLVAVDVFLAHRGSFQALRNKAWWLTSAAGLLTVGAVFALATPFFFLSFDMALQSLRTEARSSHLGADGLSPIGNLWWYLTTALPADTGWPQLLLAGLGTGLVLKRREPRQLLLLVFLGVYTLGIIISPLHWARWLIQILPVISLLGAYALVELIWPSIQRLQAGDWTKRAVAVAALVAVSAWPAYHTALHNIGQINPSTRIQAREWMIHNLPPGTHIAQEWYCAPLSGTSFAVSEQGSLAVKPSLDDYRREGITHLVASSSMYGRFMAQPDRYPAENAFYQELFSQARLLQQFDASLTAAGPTVRIYELPSQ